MHAALQKLVGARGATGEKKTASETDSEGLLFLAGWLDVNTVQSAWGGVSHCQGCGGGDRGRGI